MKTLIICASYHHKNTMNIGKKMAEVLDATIIEPKDFHEDMLNRYGLIGFGSGIYNGKHHKSILALANQMKEQQHKHAFVFSTSTIPAKTMHKAMNDILTEKGFKIIGQFSCKGFMNYSFSKYIFGGLNKGRPNKRDYIDAMNFAKKIKAYQSDNGEK
ncbi:flavodoxin family protein [Vallitalea pronyensis]|uniref:Flavodoxin family protein n=1 Tax=Vallitalea pronyensis TaxID=1348613 RepID=A0A8J8MPM2_9FIRM|nr:flavodoxin family protein [Vallitalea pronyensis]QUI25655.1 flavodoxin family protein [Vallitalea pronyensis]